MKCLNYILALLLIFVFGCTKSTDNSMESVVVFVDSVSYNYNSAGIKIKLKLCNYTADTLFLQYSNGWPAIWINYNVSGKMETRLLNFRDTIYIKYLISGGSFSDTLTTILEKGNYYLSGEGILSATKLKKERFFSSNFSVQ